MLPSACLLCLTVPAPGQALLLCPESYRIEPLQDMFCELEMAEGCEMWVQSLNVRPKSNVTATQCTCGKGLLSDMGISGVDADCDGKGDKLHLSYVKYQEARRHERCDG